MYNIKQLILILCILLVPPQMASAASRDATGKEFKGQFSIELAMHAFYGNSKVKKPDNPMAIILNMEPIAHSDWVMEQYCSVDSLKRSNLLDTDKLKYFSSFITEYGPKATFEAFVYDVLPFTVKGIKKVFLVTQSSFCGANSCPAIIGVLLWANSENGWRLENSSPCLLSMSGESGSYYGSITLQRIDSTIYGLRFQSRLGDQTYEQVVAEDKNGDLRVIHNDAVGNRN